MSRARSGITVLLLSLPLGGIGDASAAVSSFSRANCLGFVNESVTWDRPLLLEFFGSVVSTHVPLSPIDADFATAQAERLSLEHAMRMREGLGPAPGGLQIVPLAAYPAPAEVKKRMAAGFAAHNHPARVPATQIPSQDRLLDGVGKKTSRLTSVDAGAARLHAVPGSALPPTHLLGSQPAGVIKDGNASGISQIYRVDGLGVIELSMDDYVSAGTHLQLVREAFNTHVGSTPGTLSAIYSADGRAMVILHWVTPTFSNRMVLLTDTGVDVEHARRQLLALASGVQG